MHFIDLDRGQRSRLSKSFYVQQAASVLVHLIFFELPTLVVLSLLVTLQTDHISTLDPSPDPLATKLLNSPYEFISILTSQPGRLDQTLVGIWWFLLSICLVVFINLLCVYTGCNHVANRIIFSLIFRLILVIFSTYICMSCVWVLLAVILNPAEFLPWGTAIITFVTVVAWQYRRFSKMALQLRASIREQYRRTLATSIERLQRAQGQLRAQVAHERRRRQTRDAHGSLNNEASRPLPTRLRASRPAAAPLVAAEAEPFEPGSLFDLLDSDGCGFLVESEFYAMFHMLDLNISESKQQMMFAYADGSSKGMDSKISRDEFIASWAWLEETMASSIAESLGLAPEQIAFFIGLLVFVLVVVLIFVLVAIVAFNTQGGFVAVVQSSIISGAGYVTRHVAKRPKAEQLAEVAPKELEGYIKAGIQSETESQTEADASA